MSDRPGQDWAMSSTFQHTVPPTDSREQYQTAIVPQTISAQSPTYDYHQPETSQWFPQIISYTPNSGSAGSLVKVQIRTAKWPPQHSQYQYFLVFGDVAVFATNTTAHTGEDDNFYLGLQAQAPSSYLQSGDVSLGLKVVNGEGRVVSAVAFGSFNYVPRATHGGYIHTAPQDVPTSSSHPRYIAGARESIHSLQTDTISQNAVTPMDATSTSWTDDRAQMSTDQQYTTGPLYASYDSTPVESPTGITAGSYSTVQSRMDLQPRHGPSRYFVSQVPRDERGDASYPRNPVLVRTSMLQGASGEESSSQMATRRYSPYLIYPSNKAVLRLDGDLDSMGRGWSDEEREIGRRLVQFTREQTGNIIAIRFQPVTPVERIPGGICVSCIWWEEKKEAFVTSVDTIALLERVVGSRFTVEEKNRIRRNLEGFHPLTISKAKCETFFTAIMRFPPPKPRNIEKDVKVFPWRSLSSALKKIVGKYVSENPSIMRRCRMALTSTQSASYSSPTSLSFNPTMLRSASGSPGHEPSPSSQSASSHTSAPLPGALVSYGEPYQAVNQTHAPANVQQQPAGTRQPSEMWATPNQYGTSTAYEMQWGRSGQSIGPGSSLFSGHDGTWPLETRPEGVSGYQHVPVTCGAVEFPVPGQAVPSGEFLQGPGTNRTNLRLAAPSSSHG